jgi:hypothetical protein
MRRPGRRRLPAGPAQRVQQARLNLQQAQASGTPAQVFDARYALGQAEERFQKAMGRGGDDFGKRVMSAIGSTRLVIGPQGISVAPLISSISRLFGKDSPVGTAAAGAAAGLMVLEQATQQTVAAFREFGNAQLLAGATPAEAARFGAVTGDVGSFAAHAAALQHVRSTDVFAMQEAGVSMPRPFAAADEGTALLKEMQTLHEMRGDPEAQIRRARILQMEWALSVVNVSEQVWQAQKRLAAETQRANTPENIQAAQDYAAWQRVIGQEFQNLQSRALAPTLQSTVHLFEDLDTALQRLGPHLAGANEALLKTGDQVFGKDRTADLIKQGQETMSRVAVGTVALGGVGAIGAIGVSIWEAIKGQFGFGSKAAGSAQATYDPSKATDDNTAAIEALTALLRQLGGGRRAAGAIPVGLRGAGNRQASMDAGLDLRGFRL